MTLFGKVLVLVNLGLSMAMAAWAIGIYTQRIDWSANKGTADKAPGELVRRQERFRQLTDTHAFASLRWRDAVAGVSAAEKRRWQDQQWYAAELKKLDVGMGPIKAVAYNKAGQIILDANTGQPQMVDIADNEGKPIVLAPTEVYRNEWKTTEDATTAELKKIDKLVEEEKQLTTQMNADKIGLRALIAREDENRRRVLEEQKDLQPVKVNTLVESELLLKRQAQLQARVAELKRVLGVSNRQP